MPPMWSSIRILSPERIVRFADLLGRERVIASTDCGLGGRIHPNIAWLEALAQGAALEPSGSGADSQRGSGGSGLSVAKR